MSLKEILNHARFSQVGFVVNDIEETKKKYALLFGVTEPATNGGERLMSYRQRSSGNPHPRRLRSLPFSI